MVLPSAKYKKGEEGGGQDHALEQIRCRKRMCCMEPSIGAPLGLNGHVVVAR